jgi:Fe-S oxidoreductase
MCPSFRVTRDEQHGTRGRANTLRLALSGQLGSDALASDAVREAMELCVSCKGCRRECPTGVDMAKMKIEFLHHHRQRHGLTLRDRLIGHLPRYASWAARLPWLVNLRNRSPLVARLAERVTGLAANRRLPEFRRDRFTSTVAVTRAGGEVPAGGRRVVLFADTFDNSFEPENLSAAHRVLAAAGYDVTVLVGGDGRPLCCGRTYLGTGMVGEARAEAQRTLDALLPYVRAGAAVVGLEPSCLLGLRDEFLVLKLGAGAQELAEASVLFEEFIAREAAAGRFALDFRPLARTALLHGHCHQKAFGAIPSVAAALALVPQLKVQPIESSCCGMAGSFGYEAAHQQLSMAMAEASLLPAVRAAPDDALIVADGTSCRHQIADGAHREALHVARVMAMALPAA